MHFLMCRAEEKADTKDGDDRDNEEKEGNSSSTYLRHDCARQGMQLESIETPMYRPSIWIASIVELAHACVDDNSAVGKLISSPTANVGLEIV